MHTATGSASAALLAGMDGGCPLSGIAAVGSVGTVVGTTAAAQRGTASIETIRTHSPGHITSGTGTDTAVTPLAVGTLTITELTRTGPIVVERSGIWELGSC